MADDSDLESRLARRLGRRLAELRASRELTQEQVAHAAGLSRNHYQLMERGFSDRTKQRPANPRLSTLRGIAEVMGLSVSDLLTQLLADQPLTSGGRLQVPPGSPGTGSATTRGTAGSTRSTRDTRDTRDTTAGTTRAPTTGTKTGTKTGTSRGAKPGNETRARRGAR